MNTTAYSQLDKAKMEYEAACEAAKAKLDSQMAGIISQAKADLVKNLQSILEIYEVIPSKDQGKLWKDKEVSKLLRELALSPVETTVDDSSEPSTSGGRGKGGGKYDEAAILAFVGEGKLQTEVQKHFGVANPTMISWGKKLAGKIEIGKADADKTQNFWRKI